MEIMTTRSVGERLRTLRSSQDLTQSEAAERIGVSLRYYQSLESDSSQPSVETLMKALSGLRVTFDEFFAVPKPPEEKSRKALVELLAQQEAEIDELKQKVKKLERAYDKVTSSPWLEAYEKAGFGRQRAALALLIDDETTPNPLKKAEALMTKHRKAFGE